MSAGWYLMHRGWMSSADFQAEPFTEREAFLWSIEKAAFEPHQQWFNGVQIPVGRGEFVTSIRKMAAAFKWGDKRAFLFVARMERSGKWTRRTQQREKHGPTILGICNYERFQTPAKFKEAAEATPKATPTQQPGNSQATQQKEGIKNTNEGERKEEVASPLRAASLPYETAIGMWSEAAAIKGWSPVNPTLPLSDKRRRGLGSILETHGLEGWRDAIQRALDSAVLGGPDPPGWFNFEFVTNPDKFLRLSEGNYDRNFTSNSAPPKRSGWLDANKSLSGELQSSRSDQERTLIGR